jgi:hypothetical protein
MMRRLTQSHPGERVAISWIVAGLALLTLVGLSFSIEEPAPGAAAVPADVPVYAIDEDLAPLQTGALGAQDQYAELVAPVTYRPDEVRTGVAP